MSIRGWIGCLVLLCLSVTPAAGQARAAPSPVGSDFNGDGYADLAVGAAFEDLLASNMGAVHVIYGSPSGLASEGNQLWSQDSPGVEDGGETTDSFGSALTWASHQARGDRVFDVQVQRPGSPDFEDWKTGVQRAGSQFLPDAGPGVYLFRARLRNVDTGATTGYSPTIAISVN